ncbi:MAG: ABC transporter ATP-binding protein [Anaerolineae bacterium]|jgi:ABC-2 type transport system ATP-binding protein
MAHTSVLDIRELRKTFGPLKAVDGISLSVQPAEVFGFLGPNGAGKTTTIGMLLGLIHPTAGEIRLFGERVSPSRTRALSRVGALVGSPAIVPYLSARRNLELLARLHPGVTDERIAEVLAQVGLSGAADRAAGRYSTGMKQRLGLAMALLHRPELLILDEPTNGMDPAGMRDVRTLLRQLASEGMTVFLSSHLLHEVEQVCDRVAVLNRGRVVAQGSVEDLMNSQEVVKVQVTAPEPAAQALRTLPGVSAVQGNGRYVQVSGVPAESVVRHLTAHGIVPAEVTTSRPDLESLFLDLTQQSDEAAEASSTATDPSLGKQHIPN